MEIVSIKKIQNIGTFANFINGGSCRFEKFTFIYGLNTVGKTTLTGIFQSLKENNTEIISKRRTIPVQPGQQKVVLSVKDQSESDIKFENNSWGQNDVSKNLEVFGTDFIHKNLFTGLLIERENRENLTQFILGEQGVKIAEEIAQKKKELGDKRRELKTKIPNFIKDKTDNTEIKNFLEYSIEGLQKDKIENTLSQKNIVLQKEQERLKEPQKILQLQEPSRVDLTVFTIIEAVKSINILLQNGYQGIKEEALSKLKKHLSDNFSFEDNAENWIKAGNSYCKDRIGGNCPFCGQSLRAVQDLIDAYGLYFNQEYNDFITKIVKELESKKREIENTVFTQKTVFQTALVRLNQYKELITDSNFQSGLADLQTSIELLHEEYLAADKTKILAEIKTKYEQKSKCPCNKVDIIDFSGIEKKLNLYNEISHDIKKNIDTLLEKIKYFKKRYENIETIQQGINSLNTEITDLEYQNERIEHNDECVNYKKLQQEIELLDADISKLDNQLRKDQSEYLDNYFNQINDLFKRLGSRDFTLEKEEDRSGYFPVYSLRIKFKGVTILNSQLPTVFSESDRRALALAIFWAKINLIDEVEKRKIIIILDDPVASFDDNRVTNSIGLFNQTMSEVSQIIILTHYSFFIKRFCDISYGLGITTKFLEIKSDNTTSFLTVTDKDIFTMCDYEKVFIKIYGFINKLHLESIKTDLRPFLENLYIPTVFAKQIHDKKVDCSTLKTKIDGIFDSNDKVKKKFHEFREALNPDSHLFTNNNDEDVRNFAIDMINYLYPLN